MGFGEVTPVEALILMVIPAVAVILPFWQIFKKAGFSPYLSLLMLIPPVNFVLLYFVAFASWPVINQRCDRG